MNPADSSSWNTGFGFIPSTSDPNKTVYGLGMKDIPYCRIEIPTEEIAKKIAPALEWRLITRVNAHRRSEEENEKEFRRNDIDRFWTTYYSTMENTSDIGIPKLKEANAFLHLLLTSYMEATQFPSCMHASRQNFIGFPGVVRILVAIYQYFLDASDEIEPENREKAREEMKKLTDAMDIKGNTWYVIKSQTEVVMEWCEDNSLPDVDWVHAVGFICSEIVDLVRSTI